MRQDQDKRRAWEAYKRERAIYWQWRAATARQRGHIAMARYAIENAKAFRLAMEGSK